MTTLEKSAFEISPPTSDDMYKSAVSLVYIIDDIFALFKKNEYDYDITATFGIVKELLEQNAGQGSEHEFITRQLYRSLKILLSRYREMYPNMSEYSFDVYVINQIKKPEKQDPDLFADSFCVSAVFICRFV